MPTDSKEILKRAKESNNKVRFNFTLTASVLREFKEYCDKDGASYSSVIEELIKDFLYPETRKKK